MDLSCYGVRFGTQGQTLLYKKKHIYDANADNYKLVLIIAREARNIKAL